MVALTMAPISLNALKNTILALFQCNLTNAMLSYQFIVTIHELLQKH
jgi:hypothetical protein